jgi:phage FluMu gp28-like protein
MDIGRKRNLSVIWICELLDRRKVTRIVHPMEQATFRVQYATLKTYLQHPHCHRASIDQGGIGAQIAEDAQLDFGTYRVEAVTFNNTNKIRMAESVKTDMEDREFLIPGDGELKDIIREDFHSVQQVVSNAGNTRFDPTENEELPNSHADFFWAAALSRNAADTVVPEPLGAIHTPANHMGRPDRSARIDRVLDGYEGQFNPTTTRLY